MRQLQTPESMLPDYMEPIPATQPVEESATSATTAAVATETAPEESTETADNDDTVTVAGDEASDAGKPTAETVQVSDPNVVDDDELDGLSKQERQLLDAIYKQTVKVSLLGLQERKLAAELEDLRAELSASRDMKTSLLNDLPDALLTLRDGVTATEKTVDNVSQTGDSPATTETAEVDPNTLSTRTILDGVPGLGAKKADTLVDAFPTLGELEAARAEAGRAHKHFAEMLPKGLGKNIADELTNRMLHALAGNTKPCAEQVKENRTAKADESAPRMPAANVEAQPENWATEMAVKLVHGIDEGSCDSQCNADAWRKGYDAYEENVTVETVLADLGDEPEEIQAEWIRGWLSAELNEKQDIEAQEADEVDEAEEAAAEANSAAIEESSSDGSTDVYEDVSDEDSEEEPTDLEGRLEKVVNIADRESFAEHVKSTNDLRFKHDKESWQAGYEASIDEQPLEACPSTLTDDQESDWIRGWVDGSSIGANL